MDAQEQWRLFYEIFDSSFPRLDSGDDASTARALGSLLGAVSELAWLLPDPPAECAEFFAAGYPAMLDVPAIERLIADRGFELVDEFVLPDSSWWDCYYRPLEGRLARYRDKFAAEPEKLELLERIQAEIDIRRTYGKYYGNVFFLLQRPG